MDGPGRSGGQHVLRVGASIDLPGHRTDLRPYRGDDHTAGVARLRGLGATDANIEQGDVRG